MNLTDVLTTSYHYFYRIYLLKATEENRNFDISEFKELNARDIHNLTL